MVTITEEILNRKLHFCAVIVINNFTKQSFCSRRFQQISRHCSLITFAGVYFCCYRMWFLTSCNLKLPVKVHLKIQASLSIFRKIQGLTEINFILFHCFSFLPLIANQILLIMNLPLPSTLPKIIKSKKTIWNDAEIRNCNVNYLLCLIWSSSQIKKIGPYKLHNLV